MHAAPVLDELQVKDDYAIGVDIVRRALTEPAFLIASNAGYSGQEVVDEMAQMGVDEGFDALEGRFGNMIEMGIIDPLRVCRSALQNGASVAGLLLTTNTLDRRGADTVGRQPGSDDRVRPARRGPAPAVARLQHARSRWASARRSDDRGAAMTERGAAPAAGRRVRRLDTPARGAAGRSRRHLRGPADGARRCCERLRRAPSWPAASMSPTTSLVEAVWTSALLSYARCFGGRPKGGRPLTEDDLTAVQPAATSSAGTRCCCSCATTTPTPAANPRERFSVGVAQSARRGTPAASPSPRPASRWSTT